MLMESCSTFKELPDYSVGMVAPLKSLSYIAYVQDAVGSCPR